MALNNYLALVNHYPVNITKRVLKSRPRGEIVVTDIKAQAHGGFRFASAPNVQRLNSYHRVSCIIFPFVIKDVPTVEFCAANTMYWSTVVFIVALTAAKLAGVKAESAVP